MTALSKLALAACALVLSLPAASAQTVGDWVLARHKGGDHWYPGVLERVSGNRVTVTYDDGDRETLSLSAVRPYNWAIGTRVECNFRGTGEWHPGVIASLSGEFVGINYNDGDRERTKTGRCRTR
jgi:hypothetical protein